MELTQEIKDLFEMARLTFGGEIRKVELTDKALCASLERALLLYNEYVLNFIIENKWTNFYNKSKMTDSEIAFTFSTNTLDYSRDFSDYFSHLVGLQQHGSKWELKKDYIETVAGQQVYTIPAGRLVNRVLYFTPPTTDSAKIANWAGVGMGLPGLGGAQLAVGSFAGGYAGMWGVGFPMYDIALTSVDFKTKNGFYQGDFVYKITAANDGTHLLHLMNVPGGLFDRMGGFGRFPGQKCYIWYTYYDVAPGEEDDCLTENASNVYLSPDQIKLDMKHYGVLNDAAKATVVRLFLANAAQTLSFVRGKFSGNINLIGSPLTLDYGQFADFARTEKESALTDLKDRLFKLSPNEILKREAEMVKSIKEIRGGTPLKIYAR
ncbi:MAG: hypothetical protein J6X18_12295 [Bacteroidales bacterium]|nr:hypothetical protein [Bacteroidales bacterium]